MPRPPRATKAHTGVDTFEGAALAHEWEWNHNPDKVASANVSGNRIWLRLSVDIRPGANRQGRFSYSTDGSQFTSIGTPFTMTQDWQSFMGYRFAIFNFATQALGGSVTVGSFSLTSP